MRESLSSRLPRELRLVGTAIAIERFIDNEIFALAASGEPPDELMIGDGRSHPTGS